MVTPLTDLLKVLNMFGPLSVSTQQAFEQVKALLCAAPVLAATMLGSALPTIR